MFKNIIDNILLYINNNKKCFSCEKCECTYFLSCRKNQSEITIRSIFKPNKKNCYGQYFTKILKLNYVKNGDFQNLQHPFLCINLIVEI